MESGRKVTLNRDEGHYNTIIQVIDTWYGIKKNCNTVNRDEGHYTIIQIIDTWYEIRKNGNTEQR